MGFGELIALVEFFLDVEGVVDTGEAAAEAPLVAAAWTFF